VIPKHPLRVESSAKLEPAMIKKNLIAITNFLYYLALMVQGGKDELT
jgi:hypothetical protein